MRLPVSFCQRDGLGCACICLASTGPSPKSRNDVEDSDMPDLDNDPAALSYEPSDRAAENTFTSSFRLDSISYNMGKLDEALFAICNHRSVSVRVMLTLKDKIYKRQIVGLRDLYNAKDNLWRYYLFGKDMTTQRSEDFFKNCSDESMSLLSTDGLNNSHVPALSYLRKIRNGVGIINSPAATGKTAFIERVVQPFLFDPSSHQVSANCGYALNRTRLPLFSSRLTQCISSGLNLLSLMGNELAS